MIVEFLVTVFAVILGLVAGKFMSVGLQKLNVPIASGDPQVA